MISPPNSCGKVAEPFFNLAVYYCDICGEPPLPDRKLRWFTASTLICDNLECAVAATDLWEIHCQTGTPFEYYLRLI